MESVEIDPSLGWGAAYDKLCSKIEKELPWEVSKDKYHMITSTIMTFDSGHLRTTIGKDSFLYITWNQSKENSFSKAVVWYALTSTDEK